jgi:hypothetical protein
MPGPPQLGGAPTTNIPNTASGHCGDAVGPLGIAESVERIGLTAPFCVSHKASDSGPEMGSYKNKLELITTMNIKMQKASVWGGFVGANMLFLALIVMGFLPPPSPAMSSQQLASIYSAHQNMILLGSVLAMTSGMFVGPFVAVLFLQLRRMEGEERPIGSYGQLITGAGNMFLFTLPGIFFAAAAFRPDRSPEITQAMSDIAFITTLFPWSFGAMEALCTGLVILAHSHANDSNIAYPRWLGYMSLWIFIGMPISSVIPFFKSVPFAWNGLFGWWLPAILFGAWFMVVWWMTLRAVNNDALSIKKVQGRGNPAAASDNPSFAH